MAQLLSNKKASFLKKAYLNFRSIFLKSENYWIKRYKRGYTSGTGSYDNLAMFKAEILNMFVKDKNINTIMEFGCGDGNQLKLAEYPSYIGFDVSPDAIEICKKNFENDKTKQFKLVKNYNNEKAQLTLSLDVIYHLLEDSIYEKYMHKLFNSSEKYVIIYSSDFEEKQDFHERRRKFSSWIESNMPQWKLIEKIQNKFPFTGTSGSLSDFYIYEMGK